MEVDVEPSEKPQVLFSDYTRIGEESEDDKLSIASGATSEVSSIPAVNTPVLKSTATLVQRSKDYADQLELILNHFQHSTAAGKLN